MAYNRVILEGNITRDPELRTTNSGTSVVNFGLAVNRVRSKNDEVDFFDITVWGKAGETVHQYKKKGDPVLLEGRLQQSRWQDSSGNNRSRVEVVAETVQFLGRANGNGGGSPADDLGEDDFDDIPF